MKNLRDVIRYGAVLAAVVLAGGTRAADEPEPKGPLLKTPLPAIDRAFWIWSDPNDMMCQIRTTITLDEPPEAAKILITADNGYELYVNGAPVGFDVGKGGEIWKSLEGFDITSRLAQGRNAVGIRAICLGGGRGLVAAIRIENTAGAREIVTDDSWHVSVLGDPEEYSHPEFLEGPEWLDAKVLGPMGMAPWGTLRYAGSRGGRREGALPSELALTVPGDDFRWPEAVAFVGDDCSVYVPVRGDAWGVCFRVGLWSRAYTEFDIPCPAKIGRTLYTLEPGPAAEPRVLIDAGTGVLGSPSASYDGRSIYVAMAPESESFFHIWRVPVAGGPPRRLTDGPFHDIDPAELPDGRIVFTSTRIGTFEEYHNPPSRALFVMNTDGSDIHPITFTPSFDNEPKVLADGRIAFIRTDNFFDRAKVETQIHAVRPDGTDGYTEVGAHVGADYGVRLRKFGYGSPAPLPDGRLACITSGGNFIATPGAAEQSYHVLPGGLGDLAPLPDGRLLATVLRADMAGVKSNILAVIDPGADAVVSIYESPHGSIHSPVSLQPRPRPPIIPDRANQRLADKRSATGFLTCQNARFTRKNKADWDQIRAIRVLGALALTTRSSHSHIVHAGHEAVELGTVPLAPDGSFSIEVPADMPLALQAVDAEGRSELNEMSWIYVRPGEHRTCIGCHHSRNVTPALEDRVAQSLRARPLKLLGQGQPHRFRGNNGGVTGMMDLQFERFRETASLNRHLSSEGPLTTGRQEVAAQIERLRAGDESLRISAAQRLAIFRDRSAAPMLAERLQDTSGEVRAAATLALAACGTRESVPPLLDALADEYTVAAQAAAVALENLTGHAESFQPFVTRRKRTVQAEAWREWFRSNTWDAVEQSLIKRIGSNDRAFQRRAIVALGHVGGARARAALRQFVAAEKGNNPYPPFEGHNRTDRFTFSADSPLNPRTLQEATRAIGYLKDTDAIPLLREILAENTEPRTANLFLAEAAVEALGSIATAEAEMVLIDTFATLGNYWDYVGWYSDHPALYACHASPLHARAIIALDAMGSTRAGAIVPHLIRSVPTDPDRALFPENDDYETLVGRVIRRSGRGGELVETCLALLGDPEAEATGDLKEAVSTTFAAWAGTPAPDNRAAQILSLLCRDAGYEPRIRRLYEAYRARGEEPIERPLGNPSWIPQRHWVLFFLGRTLGNLASAASVDTLVASLSPDLNEARHGRPDPSEPNIHFLQLEYTPCWRVTAAWALGCIGDRRCAPALLNVVGDLRNAVDVRHAAAEALGKLADADSLAVMRELAEDYPEYSVRRALLRACMQNSGELQTASLD